MTVAELEQMVERALAKTGYAQVAERAAESGITVQLRESRERLSDTRQRAAAGDKKFLKAERRQYRQLFEGMGMSVSEAKRAARATQDRDRAEVADGLSTRLTESELQERERRHQARLAEERRAEDLQIAEGLRRRDMVQVNRIQLDEAQSIFQELGLSPQAAAFAAAGRA
jgi:hypothetical protein